jgi:hypothetical protein
VTTRGRGGGQRCQRQRQRSTLKDSPNFCLTLTPRRTRCGPGQPSRLRPASLRAPTQARQRRRTGEGRGDETTAYRAVGRVAPVTTRADVVDAIPSWPRWLQRELRAAPAYLATVRADGSPRVHPVTPIVTAEGLYVFMESTPPKGADLPVRSQCAPPQRRADNAGTGGEVAVLGTGHLVNDPKVRLQVAVAASYEPADRYVLFEVQPTGPGPVGAGASTAPSRSPPGARASARAK